MTDYANFAGNEMPARSGPGGIAVGGGNDTGAASEVRRSDVPASGTNVISVRVDATLSEGWFYEGAGIYRHVWLNKTPQLRFAQDGTFIRTDFAKANGVITSADPATIFVTL